MTFGMQEAYVDDSGVLHCPRCSEPYLHQRDTTIFERAEDAEITTVIAQNAHSVEATQFPSADTCNPSSRRRGLIIEFLCESCHGEDTKTVPAYRLAILQHKGNTYVEWV